MPFGPKALRQIIDLHRAYCAEHPAPPKIIKLPIDVARDLAKVGREELGELSDRIAREGIDGLEGESLFGMRVHIVREPATTIQFE